MKNEKNQCYIDMEDYIYGEARDLYKSFSIEAGVVFEKIKEKINDSKLSDEEKKSVFEYFLQQMSRIVLVEKDSISEFTIGLSTYFYNEMKNKVNNDEK